MALVPTPIPADVRAAVIEAAARWNTSSRDEVTFDLRPLRILQPLPLYRHVGGYREGRMDLGAAERHGWRCFLRSKSGRFFAVDIVRVGERFAFRLHVGAVAEHWLRHVRLAKKRRRLREGVYELRTLIAPAVHVCCLWFSAGRGQEDLFIPIEMGALEELEAKPWISRDELESVVGRKASRTIQLWAEAREPGTRG